MSIFATRTSSKKFEVDLYNRYSFQVVGNPEIMRWRAGILYDNGEKTMFTVGIRHDVYQFTGNDDTGKLVNPVVYILWIVNKRLVVYIIIIQLYTIIKYIYYSIIL